MTGKAVALSCASLALITIGSAQRRNETPSWGLKPVELLKYTGPHKPHTKLAEVKAAHAGHKAWSHLVVDDERLHSEFIQSPPGAKTPRRFHPDTRVWWVIIEGQIRFTIEGTEPFTASKGSMVQVPYQTIYEMETVGDGPAIRFETSIAGARTLYPEDTKPPAIPGWTWIPVTLNRKAAPLEHENRYHIELDEVANRPQYKDKNFLHRFVHDDRGVANIIYGQQKRLPPLNTADKGHYHPECAEYWLIMRGQIRYPIEGQGVVIASEGDVVYVPKFTFHAPRFWGEGDACRLAMNAFPNIAHLFEAPAK